MFYVIDGNNLAGKMELLYKDDWQQELIELLENYFANTRKEIILVFDSADPMGDKYRLKGITIIHAPKDEYYQSADDKIKELIQNHLTRVNKSEKMMVVTDDIEIREEVEEGKNKGDKGIFSELSSELARKLGQFESKEGKGGKIDNKTGLGDDEVDKINEELRKKWGI